MLMPRPLLSRWPRRSGPSAGMALPTMALLAATLLAGCQVGGSAVERDDGYYTWVDEKGQVHISRIPRKPDAEPLITPKPSRPLAEKAPAPVTAIENAPGTAPTAAQSGEPNDEYTLENYPDAEQLARDGYVRKGETRKPYFTWIDAQGQVRVQTYTPDTRSEVEKGRKAPPITLSPAIVHRPGEGGAPPQPVEGYDPQALAILGAENTGDVFGAFTKRCCESLSAADREDWTDDREFEVAITEDAPRHDFSTGSSHFRVVSLPPANQRPDFVLHLRSFAGSGSGGLFVPSLVFLDSRFHPVRLVTDIAFGFSPETWRTEAYLEAWVPVFPARGERYLVLFTRDADRQGQTVTETRRGPVAIPYVGTGNLGLERVTAP